MNGVIKLTTPDGLIYKVCKEELWYFKVGNNGWRRRKWIYYSSGTREKCIDDMIIQLSRYKVFPNNQF